MSSGQLLNDCIEYVRRWPTKCSIIIIVTIGYGIEYVKFIFEIILRFWNPIMVFLASRHQTIESAQQPEDENKKTKKIDWENELKYTGPEIQDTARYSKQPLLIISLVNMRKIYSFTLFFSLSQFTFASLGRLPMCYSYHLNLNWFETIGQLVGVGQSLVAKREIIFVFSKKEGKGVLSTQHPVITGKTHCTGHKYLVHRRWW